MEKILKKFAERLYWKFAFPIYTKRRTWGVQWGWNERWRDTIIADKTFWRKKSAENYWKSIKDKVQDGQEAVFWEINKGDYNKILDSINY